MKPTAPPQHDDQLLAVAERRSGSFRVLLVRRGDRPTVVEAATFAEGETGALAGWMSKHGCRSLRMVLPASSTIVRLVSMPKAPEHQMLAALRLQAEGIFLGSVPACRMSLSILGSEDGEERQGCIMAWPESQPGIALPQALDALTTFIPEPAAMLALGRDGLTVSANGLDGSIAIVLHTDKGVVVRATREAPSQEAEGWREDLERSIAETALHADASADDVKSLVEQSRRHAIEADGQTLVVDPGVASHLAGILDLSIPEAADSDWVRRHAILLGAAVAASGPGAARYELHRRDESDEPNRLRRLVQRYSQPARALRVALVAALVLAAAPVASSWLRLKVVEWKLPTDAGTFVKSQQAVDRRIAHYAALSKRAVPMMKILGDLACCTPDGIEVESLQISATQGVSVRGAAKAQGEDSAAEVIKGMARMMDASGVFEKTTWRFSLPDRPGNFKFDLSSSIAQPTMTPRYPEERDWSIKTLADRKYPSDEGEEAAGAAPAAAGTTTAASTTENGGSAAEEAAGAGESPASSGGATRGTTRTTTRTASAGTTRDAATSAARGIGRRTPSGSGTEGEEQPTSGAGAGGPAGASQPATPVPESVSDEQIKSMSADDLKLLIAEISNARRRRDLEPEVMQRLVNDFNRVLSRLKELSPS